MPPRLLLKDYCSGCGKTQELCKTKCMVTPVTQFVANQSNARRMSMNFRKRIDLVQILQCISDREDSSNQDAVKCSKITVFEDLGEG